MGDRYMTKEQLLEVLKQVPDGAELFFENSEYDCHNPNFLLKLVYARKDGLTQWRTVLEQDIQYFPGQVVKIWSFME